MNLDGVSLLIGAAIGAALFAAYQRNSYGSNATSNGIAYNAQFGDKTYSGNIRFPQIGAQNQ